MKTDNNVFINEVELYLEGIKIPTFNSIQISESLNATPAALVTFLNTVDVLKLLPGTLVQIFVNRVVYATSGDIVPNSKKTILLFEGEIVTISISYNSSNNLLSVRAVPVLAKILKARMRPNHVFLKQEQRDAEAIINNKFNLTVVHKDPTPDSKKEINSSQNSVEGFITPKEDITHKFDTPNSPKVEDTYTGKISDIYKENDITVLSVDIAAELHTGSASKGDYNQLLQRFNFQFEKFDLYYGLCSGSLKIGPSLLALNNSGKSKALAYLIFQKAFGDFLRASSQSPTDAGESYNLMDVFNMLQQHIMYRSIMVASPLSVISKHIDKANTKFKPIRMLFMPEIDSGPPFKSNIWFPNQILSASFERDLVNEPTRLIGIMDYTKITGMNAMPKFLNPIFVAPDLEIVTTTGEIKGKKVTNFSFEECYRGITLRESTYNGSVLKTLQNIIVGKEKKEDNLDTQSVDLYKKFTAKPEIEKKEAVEDVLKTYTLQEYNKLKYGQRMLNMNVEWSPYRVLGLPGAAILENGLNIIGTVQTISTVISADGTISSSVLLSYVRCIYDTDFDDEDSYKRVINQDTNYPASGVQSSEYQLDLVPDFCRESILGSNPFAFDQATWGFETIGKNLYAQLVHGEVKDLDESLLQYFNLELDKPQFNKIDTKILQNENYPEYGNYIKLKIAFRNLNNLYKVSDNKQEFVEDVNRRSVCLKSEYEDYLGIDFKEIAGNYKNYTKDTFKILNTIKTDLAQIELLQGANIKASVFNVVKSASEQTKVFDKYVNLKQTPFTELTDLDNIHKDSTTPLKSLYKVYDCHRQAHVRNLLNKLNIEDQHARG